ncbi:MAG: ABC transporter permease [Burkholderiaceae bacterium]
MRLEAREQPSRLAALLAPIGAVLVTLAVCALLVAWAGAPVLPAYAALFDGAFGSRFALTETLTRATPLILTGLAVAVAFRARFYNIGAEGQFYVGALAAVAVGGLHGGTGFEAPPWVLFVTMMLAAMIAGAIWLALAAFLKTRFSVDEVVVTLLSNFIVMLFVSYMLDGPMKDPMGMGWPQSVALNPELELSRLVDRTRLHTGLVIASVAAVLIWVMQRFTVFGFELRATGSQAEAARFAGIPVARVVIVVGLISGALAGLAGAVEVAGRTSYLTLDMSPGYGYTGIVVAMLAGLHPLGVVAAAIFTAGMFVGADSMSRAVGVPTYIADVIVAASLIAMLVATVLVRFRLRWR